MIVQCLLDLRPSRPHMTTGRQLAIHKTLRHYFLLAQAGPSEGEGLLVGEVRWAFGSRRRGAGSRRSSRSYLSGGKLIRKRALSKDEGTRVCGNCMLSEKLGETIAIREAGVIRALREPGAFQCDLNHVPIISRTEVQPSASVFDALYRIYLHVIYLK